MYSDLPIVYITRELADRTASLLDSFAVQRPSEGVVYWFGFQLAQYSIVTTLIVPDAETFEGGLRTTAEANAEVLNAVTYTPLVYLGQAHSHPGWRVEHSGVDDLQTFAQFNGVISVVVPWFGRYGFQLRDCGVHRHLGGKFRWLHEVERHLRVLPSQIDLRKGDSDVF